MDYQFRALTPTDEPIVWQMLMHAAHELTIEAVESQPYLARYAQNWGRAGDLGFVGLGLVGLVAGVSLNRRSVELPVGAAWLRLWLETDRGFGYVDDTIPELAMAVLPAYQGKGIGTQLLAQVLAAAKGVYPAVSLNVRADNPAVGLYQRTGFVKVEGSDIVNRTGGVSFNMVNHFEG